MKLKTTKKQIKENTYDNLYAVSYCDFQYLLRFENAFAYSTGVNGWACDYYELEFDNRKIIISTGYSPIGKWINFDCVKFYENLAKKIAHKHFKTLEDRQKAHKKLIQRFLKELINYN